MPSVLENQVRWTEHPWERGGHEWSPGQTAAGGEMLWWRGLLPRVAAHLPAGRVLEIGPGFGRWTQHLLAGCNDLIAVDLTERCIDHCRQRFAESPRFEAWTNDGESLEMVADESLDFVFSFDSLVHAEAPVLRAYLRQLARKLKPGGTGFIHHSNLRSFAGDSGELPSWLTRRNWRAESMSAKLFRAYCDEAGLRCTSQEIINWVSRSRRADRHRITGAGLPLTDVLSTFERPDATAPPPPSSSQQATRILINPGFAEEFRQVAVLADVYGRRCTAPQPTAAADASVASRPSIASRIGERIQGYADYAWTYVRDHGNALRVRRHEPIVNALRRHHCPECGGALTRTHGCTNCRAEFIAAF